jgi:hypothetical protein
MKKKLKKLKMKIENPFSISTFVRQPIVVVVVVVVVVDSYGPCGVCRKSAASSRLELIAKTA